MQIVEQNQERLSPGGALQVARHRIEEPKARGVELDSSIRREVEQCFTQLWDELRDVRGRGAQLVAKRLRGRIARASAQNLHPRPERGRSLALVAVTGKHPGSAFARRSGEDLRGARLANAGFSEEQRDPTTPTEHCREGVSELVEDLPATDEGIARVVRRGWAYRFHQVHFSREAVPAPVHSLDELPGAVVTEEAPQHTNVARQHRLRDELSRPELVEELCLRYDAASVLDEVAKHVESLWLDLEHIAIAAKLEELVVQFEFGEALHHSGVTPGVRRRTRLHHLAARVGFAMRSTYIRKRLLVPMWRLRS